MQLYFANTGSSEYLNVFGRVEITNDGEKIKRIVAKISLLVFTPAKYGYWDSIHNKMVQLF